MRLQIQRVQEPQQIQQFHDLQLEYDQSLPADLRHSTPNRTDRKQIYQDPNAAYIALIDRTTAACIRVSNLNATTDVIKGLYVKPTYRKQGIAHALLETAIGFSREHQRDRIVLDTERTRLSAAYELYQSFGFKECEPYDSVDYPNPTYMELNLS